MRNYVLLASRAGHHCEGSLAQRPDEESALRAYDFSANVVAILGVHEVLDVADGARGELQIDQP